MAKFTVHDADEAHVPGIAALQQSLGEDDLTEAEFTEVWRWLFTRNPREARATVVGLGEGDAVLGHGALIPHRFLRDGEAKTGGFFCQLMIREDFRTSNLFLKLEPEILRSCPRRGFDFIYGFIIRPRILEAHRAFGFRVLGELPILARPYRMNRIAARLVGGAAGKIAGAVLSLGNPLLRVPWRRRPGGVEVREVARFGPGFDALFARVGPRLSFAAARDARTLNWRFADSPRGYRCWSAGGEDPLGYVAVRVMEMGGLRTLAVVDLLFDPDREDVGAALLHRAHRAAVEERVDMAACLINPHSPLAPALRRFGFWKSPESFTLIAYEPKGNDPKAADAPFADWHVTWFDHDYV